MLLTEFLHQVYRPSRLDLSAESVRQMEVSVRILNHWHGSPFKLADFTEDRIRRFLADYRSKRAAATVNSKRCQLLALWRCAWEEEYLDAPPRARKVRKARECPKLPEAWTAQEVGRILSASAQASGYIAGVPAAAWWRALLLVFYDTGERRKAVFATTGADLSLPGGWIVFRRTKTGQPRLCPLHADTVAACRAIGPTAMKPIWPWPFSREALDKRFKKILARAEVAYGRDRGGLFHKIRKSTGSLVEQNGGDGAKHIGNTRPVFERHYKDPRFFAVNGLSSLPRPRVS